MTPTSPHQTRTQGWEIDIHDGRKFFIDHNTGKTTLHDPRLDAQGLGRLPDGWEMEVTPQGKQYFIDHNTKKTTTRDPRLDTGNRDYADTGLVAGNKPTPDGGLGRLPDGWEMKETPQGKQYFIDHNTKKTTTRDPRLDTGNRDYADTGLVAGNKPTPDGGLGRLPDGWEMKETPQGKQYFIDHNTKKTTTRDPRLDTGNRDYADPRSTGGREEYGSASLAIQSYGRASLITTGTAELYGAISDQDMGILSQLDEDEELYFDPSDEQALKAAEGKENYIMPENPSASSPDDNYGYDNRKDKDMGAILDIKLPSDQCLPEGVAITVKDTGLTFFVDHKSKKTLKEDPRTGEVYPIQAPFKLPNGWKVTTTPHGVPDAKGGAVFFFNTVTREKRFTDPRLEEYVRRVSGSQIKSVDHLEKEKERQREVEAQAGLEREERLKSRIVEDMNRAALMIQRVFRGSQARARLLEQRENKRFFMLHKMNRQKIALPPALGSVGNSAGSPVKFRPTTNTAKPCALATQKIPKGPVGSPLGASAQRRKAEMELVRKREETIKLSEESARKELLPRKKLVR